MSLLLTVFSNYRRLDADRDLPYSGFMYEARPGFRTQSSTQKCSSIQAAILNFHWDNGEEQTAGGFTSDVPLDGALILSSKCPPVGANVRIEVLIPSPDHSSEELRIECTGKVTRVVEQAGCSASGVFGTFDDDHLTRQVML